MHRICILAAAMPARSASSLRPYSFFPLVTRENCVCREKETMASDTMADGELLRISWLRVGWVFLLRISLALKPDLLFHKKIPFSIAYFFFVLSAIHVVSSQPETLFGNHGTGKVR
jgi:hypothetical protein